MSKIFIMCLFVIATLSSTQADIIRFPRFPSDPGRETGRETGREREPGRDRDPGRGSRIEFQIMGSFRVQKILETTNTVRINHPNVKAVRFIARDNSVEIIEARLLLENGREVFMDGVTGGLGQDRGVTYTLDSRRGERVRSITVRAVTRDLVGSRATLDIAVGSLN